MIDSYTYSSDGLRAFSDQVKVVAEESDDEEITASGLLAPPTPRTSICIRQALLETFLSVISATIG